LRKAFILGDGDNILVTIWKKSTLVVNTNLKAHISLIKYKQLFQFIQAKIRNVLELFATEYVGKYFDNSGGWFSVNKTLFITQVLGRKSRTFGEINHSSPWNISLKLISRIKISWTILRTKFSSLGNSRWHKTRKFMIHLYLNYFLAHLHIIHINSSRFAF